VANAKTGCRQRECIETGFLSLERNNYFCGKLMVERDFWAEQSYHMGKQRLHNVYLHGWGTICCLKVDPHPLCPNLRVILRSGLAIDCWGREILVAKDCEVELASYDKNGNGSGGKPANLYICISYKECETELVPVFLDECGCAERCAPNRIREDFDIQILTDDDFETGELEEYLCDRMVSAKEVISGPGLVDLDAGWDQFDAGRVDGKITIKTSKGTWESKDIDASNYNSVRALTDEINDPTENGTGVGIEYDQDDDRFILTGEPGDVIVLEQTGKNPLFFELKMTAYHTEYHKTLYPCPICPHRQRIILAVIEGYDQVTADHLNSEHADFRKAAYTIDNFKYRRVVASLGLIDRVIRLLAAKGL
jgi:hypothetical protein